jgi:hypothetical protein
MRYHLERRNYRLAHSLEIRGDTLEPRIHTQYILIAQKYGWPYIKETYDPEE